MVERNGPRHGEGELHVPQPRGRRLDALGRCWGTGGEQTPPDGLLGGGTLRGRCLAVRWGSGLRGGGRSLLVFAGLSSSEVFGVPNAFTRDDGRPWASAPRRLVVDTHTKLFPAGAVVNRIDSFGSCGVRLGPPVLTCIGPARPSPSSPFIGFFVGPEVHNNTTRRVKRGAQAAGGRSVRGQQLLSVRGVQNSGGGAACIVKTRCLAGPPRECDSLSGWRDERRFSLLRLFGVEEIF